MKFSIRDSYKKFFSKREFCKNGHGDSHISFKGVDEFLPVFSIFLDDLLEVRYRWYLHSAIQHLKVSWKLVQSDPNFTEGHTYIHIYIPWIHNFVTRQEDVE
jgi:hypothetical protein